MVNVYFFYDQAGTPANFSEIASGYQNRLILLGGTPLETGGADNHNHPVAMNNGSAATANSATTAWENSTDTDCLYTSTAHHHVAGSVSIDTKNHLPPYKNFRLLYRSMTGWNKKLPTGAIVFNASVPTGWSRTESGGSTFLRTASSYGGTGGATQHDHYLSGTTGDRTETDASRADHDSYGGAIVSRRVHTHNVSGTLTATSHDYYYWSCGLIKASAESYVKKDSYLLFDGDPGAGWQLIDATNRYLKISSTNSVATGGSYTSLIHSHSGSWSFTSSGSNNTRTAYAMNTSYAGPGHNHTVTGTVTEQTVTPTYVRLLLYKATRDMGNKACATFVIC